MTESLRELLDRAKRDGWTEGLAYRVGRLFHEGEPEKMNVCVLCGWAWPGPNNRCVNPDCNGFCTWGEKKDAEPDSWVKLPGGGYRPRWMGETK